MKKVCIQFRVWEKQNSKWIFEDMGFSSWGKPPQQPRDQNPSGLSKNGNLQNDFQLHFGRVLEILPTLFQTKAMWNGNRKLWRHFYDAGTKVVSGTTTIGTGSRLRSISWSNSDQESCFWKFVFLWGKIIQWEAHQSFAGNFNFFTTQTFSSFPPETEFQFANASRWKKSLVLNVKRLRIRATFLVWKAEFERKWKQQNSWTTDQWKAFFLASL